MAPLARIPTVPLQRAIWSRTAHATCKSSTLNKAIAHALYRADYISWFTESGHHAPDASVTEQFSPEELMGMHIAHTQNRNKRQLWMGLKYRSQEWKRENGWWEHKATPVMKTILSKSQKTKSEQLVWDAADLKRLLGGEPLGEDMWRREVSEGQGVFLTIKDGIDSDKWPGFEVLESREAVERGLGGTVLLRVWPSRPRREGEGEIPEGERETVEAAQEQAGRLGKAREGPTSTIL